MKNRVLAILSLILLSGCWNPFAPPQKKPEVPQAIYFPPTSPENLIKNLQTSYNFRNFLNYEPLLDSLFVFYFNSQDANELPKYGISELRWGLQDELDATRHLFDPNWSRPTSPNSPPPQEAASAITLNLAEQQSVDWNVIDPITGLPVIWKQIVGMRVTLNVTAGETTYIVDGYATFKFRPATVDATGKPLTWKIYEWRDNGNNPNGPSGVSLKDFARAPASPHGTSTLDMSLLKARFK